MHILFKDNKVIDWYVPNRYQLTFKICNDGKNVPWRIPILLLKSSYLCKKCNNKFSTQCLGHMWLRTKSPCYWTEIQPDMGAKQICIWKYLFTCQCISPHIWRRKNNIHNIINWWEWIVPWLPNSQFISIYHTNKLYLLSVSVGEVSHFSVAFHSIVPSHLSRQHRL